MIHRRILYCITILSFSGFLFSQENKAQETTTDKLPRFFVDVNTGIGRIKGQPLTYDYPGTSSYSPDYAGAVMFGANLLQKQSKRKRLNVLSASLGVNYFAYKISRHIDDWYDESSLASTSSTIYSLHDFSYWGQQADLTFLLSYTVFYDNGFFISNKLGVACEQFIHKKEISYTSTYSYGGPDYNYNTNQWEYLNSTYQSTIHEKNYGKPGGDVSYTLSAGKKYKNEMLYAALEWWKLSNGSASSIFQFKIGYVFLLAR